MLFSESILRIIKYCDFPFSHQLRSNIYSKILKKCGTNCYFREGTRILNPENCSVGNDVSVNEHCFITASGGVHIGNYVRIAHSVSILTENHRYSNRDIPIYKHGLEMKPVIIEDDVWIGARSIILPGITIGKGAIIGAGSVVSKNVAPFTIVAGNPAIMIKER